jgi:transcriptional regulator with XRE-family HTH domain
MSTMTARSEVGGLLKEWRHRRRMSQLDLAVEADVSPRHLSFVETGRSRPSRELLLHLAEHLDVPLRDHNTLLLAAGFAPAYRETGLEAGDMAPVRDALEKILTSHEPFPAVIVDRHWNLVSGNRPALAVLTDGVDPELLVPPVNALRVSLHPRGMAPRIANLDEWSAHLLTRLHRQHLATADPELGRLYEELRGYPGVVDPSAVEHDPAAMLFVPLVLRVPEGPDLHFFSTLATFGTAVDITVAELAIESFFPADEPTGRALAAR